MEMIPVDSDYGMAETFEFGIKTPQIHQKHELVQIFDSNLLSYSYVLCGKTEAEKEILSQVICQITN